MSGTRKSVFLEEQVPDALDALVPDADPITPSSDPTCQVCETPLTWSGRGFRPKYCDTHRPGRSGKVKADDTGTAPKTTRNNPAVVRAISTLEMMYGMVGTGLRVTVAPVIGGEVVNSRKELAESYKLLLESNKRVRDWFTEVEGKAAWLPILVAHGDFAVNVMMASKIAKMPQPAPDIPGTWEEQFGDIPARPDGA